jgi:hypothetical protein
MPNKKIAINYTNRDFNSIKNDLEQHAQIYYPDTYKDFSENSFGSFVLDAVSYVGDMLSFYLDYQVNESFLETALEYENVRRLARQYGYKTGGSPSAYGIATFYVMIPANSSGLGPDHQYVPVLSKGSEFSADGGGAFVLTEEVDFNHPKNEVVAGRFSNETGKPSHYAIRSQGQVRSVVLFRAKIEVGGFKRFQRFNVGPASIAEIKSVTDSLGNIYYQVDHLSQDVIYIETSNSSVRADGVVSILKPKVVPRRFVVEQNSDGTYIQFGYGSDETITTTDVMDPGHVALKMSGKPYITDYSFDPTKLLDTNTLGIGPHNTTLTVIYYANESPSVNVNSGNLKNIVKHTMSYPNSDQNSSQSTQDTVNGSLEVSNDEPIVGNTSQPTSEEIKHRSYAAYASQNRAVTKNDYEAYCYMMPPSLGSVYRAGIINDPGATNRKMSLYVISIDGQDNLITTNSTIKQNLKVWLNKNKMLNDNIDIYNAKILNIGFDYRIVVDPTYDKLTVLNAVSRRLREQMQQKLYIGEPFYITKVWNIINRIKGVLDTTKVRMRLMTGNDYNTAPVSIEQLLSEDGTYLKTPKNVILEIKNFDKVVRGSAV